MADTESVSTSLDHSEEQLTDLTYEKLFAKVEKLIRGNDVLLIETTMFEKYMKNIDPKDNILSGVGGGQSHETSRTRKRSKSRSSSMERVLKLSAEQKCDISQRELDEIKEEIDKSGRETEKEMDNLQAVYDEADCRMNDLIKNKHDFEKDIVHGAVNPRTNKVLAEKVERWFSDKLKLKVAMIEKLRLKNATLKSQVQKFNSQLRQKEEMGEVLHEVDFKQLKIENQQYIDKIEERNQNLLKLKQMAGSTLQVLNAHKKKLRTLSMENQRLKSEISNRQQMDIRIEEEAITAEEDRLKAETDNLYLRGQLEEYKVPADLEYVREKTQMDELTSALQSWKRKAEIAEMSLFTHKKAWSQLKVASKKDNPWVPQDGSQQ